MLLVSYNHQPTRRAKSEIHFTFGGKSNHHPGYSEKNVTYQNLHYTASKRRSPHGVRVRVRVRVWVGWVVGVRRHD